MSIFSLSYFKNHYLQNCKFINLFLENALLLSIVYDRDYLVYQNNVPPLLQFFIQISIECLSFTFRQSQSLKIEKE